MTSIEKYHSEIAHKNDKLFKGEESVLILKELDFKETMENLKHFTLVF